ncbi:phosphate-selective porin O and P [Deferribacter desulfuricans SSM1]|uniref:Phosphate-selective porin O and P n=1 Tax=Deferribacter desulfuricans (strain DSM 14783 / JCM 11476 / NBRC 101012 / SSM1) TaxID=639282 RepID=D3PC25_DEFDS|nr:selenite/tellurite reduction operon porin ExtI [Deferribacter desulfuricans]BAI80148.1 phosphate-selective porin O and P [Deferribacter desulfuricans SSM1]
MRRVLTILSILVMMVGMANAFPAFKIAKGKYLKIFYDAQFGYNYRDEGAGADGTEDTNEFNFRRNRIGFIGTYNRMVSFYFQTEYIEDKQVGPLTTDLSDEEKNFYVLDAQVRFKFSNAFHIRLGKFKHNLTRENLEGCFEPLTMDRSLFVYAPFKTSRDKGVVFWGNLFDNIFQYRFDVMEGKTSGDPSPKSNFRYTGRIHLTFLDPEKSYGYKGTYLGKKKVLTIGASYQYEPDAVYDDVANATGEKDYQAYSVDGFFEYPFSFGTVTLSSAYLKVDFDDAYKGADPDDEVIGLHGERDGYYVKAGYMFPMNIGPGKLQLFYRFDNFSFGKYGNFYDQEIKWYGVGFNYYIYGQNLKITGQYSKTDFDKEDNTDPDYQDFKTFQLFLQVRL